MSKKRAIEDLVASIQKIHGDTLRLIPNQIYQGIDTLMWFEDVGYGLFQSTMYRVVCRKNKSKMRANATQGTYKRLTVDRIETKLKAINDNRVILAPEQVYKNNTQKLQFIDTEYGEFTCTMDSVLSGHGHPLRAAAERRSTCLKNFGHEHQLQSEFIKNKIIQTNIGRYGVENPQQSEGIREKTKNTNLKKYGAECSLNNKGVIEKIKTTMISKYGVEHPVQNKDIAIRIARTANKITDIPHWQTGQLVPCHGSYEVKTVQYFNKNQIEFEAQSRVFAMPNGKTYRPDFYLTLEDKWIEVKGYMRPDAQVKWDWFHAEYPNSELWTKKELKILGIL